MKIYSMTATFGSLEHQTLTLKPGLNVIEAPNEWGKSTWCAFLVNMLYGLDTRAKSTKNILADKDRYAPWSGMPMAGRIDLNWNGRDITIERRSRGRLIFGEFSAYETASGLEIPELDATNCGTMLLGVERSVFTRAGFLRLTDLPVTQDDALRRRLNNLVTTGDESGAGDKLQQALKDLKNKCRYNRTGLLPQAEAQREQLEGQLNELTRLSQQSESLLIRQAELKTQIAQLENHKAHLIYAGSLEDAEKLAAATQAQQQAQQHFDTLAQQCDALPPEQEALAALQLGQQLQQQWMDLQTENSKLPPLPQAPIFPAHYRDMSPDKAIYSAREDLAAVQALDTAHKSKTRLFTAGAVIAATLLAAIAILEFIAGIHFPTVYLIAGIVLGLGLIGCICGNALTAKRYQKLRQQICDRHPGQAPTAWETDARDYAQQMAQYEELLTQTTAQRGDLDARTQAVNQKISEYVKEDTLVQKLEYWQSVCRAWDDLADAAKDRDQSAKYLQTLRSMVKVAVKPSLPDTLAYSDAETDTLLTSARFELQQLQTKLGQTQGRSEALGQETILRSQLRAVNHRIHRLEDTYAALELAQTALSTATTELQRRFAPRISKRAQELFAKLTGSRYDRLTLSEDLSLNTCTAQEDTLRSAQWRSDGTVDQLYLALRLAVAEELTPEAPLILDDALVRFDDTRLAQALQILQETAQSKQVILFTCQSRESKLLDA